MSPRYPVLLDLAQRPCLVVGGGVVAARKTEGLLEAGAAVTVCAPKLVSSLDDHVALGHLKWRREQATTLPEPPAGEHWALVVLATDDAVRNCALATEAEATQTWANNASDPAGGAAALPAVWRDGPITLTVSTGGIHPGAAVWLRDRAADAIGPEPSVALELVAEITALDSIQRPNWRLAVESGMLGSIRAGHVAEAKERLEACLSLSLD